MSSKNNISSNQIQFPLFGICCILEHVKEIDAFKSGLCIAIISKTACDFPRKKNNFRVIVY